MSNKKNTYKSPLIESLLEKNDELEFTKERMLLALRIKSQMNKIGLSNSSLAKALGKSPSLITKWLSGTHNLTSNTLFSIQKVIKTKLIDNGEEKLVRPQYQFNVTFSKDNGTVEVSPNCLTQNTLNKLPVMSNLDC